MNQTGFLSDKLLLFELNMLKFVAPFPEPYHGQSAASLRLYELILKNKLNVLKINVASDYFLEKFWVHLLAFCKILFIRGPLYISINSNYGIWLSFFLILGARIFGEKVFIHHHSYAWINSRWFVLKFVSFAGGPKAVHVVLGEKMKKDIERHTLLGQEIFILNNAGLVSDQFLRKVNLESLHKRIVVGHLSNLSIEKGLARVVDSVIYARENGVDACLIVAGPASSIDASREIERAISLLGSDMTYLGPVYGIDKSLFFESIDVFSFPSLYRNEAAPLVLLEAFSFGVSCVAFNVGCVADTVDSKSGRLVCVDDAYSSEFFNYLSEIDLFSSSINSRIRYEELVKEHLLQLDEFIFMLSSESIDS